MAAPSPAGPSDLARERELLSRASVLVLGDASLERRVHGDFERGAGSPFRLGREDADPGAGAGIVRALAGLGVATAFVCVLGDDLAGAELTALVGAQANVEPWLLVDGAISTTTRTAYLDAGGLVLRTMREDRRPMPAKMRERMLRIAGDAMMATSLTVLSDRGHGTLDRETTGAMLATARQNGRRVIAEVEALAGLEDRFRGVDALVCASPPREGAWSPDALLDAGSRVQAALGSGAVLVLDPALGVAFVDRDGAGGRVLPGAVADYADFVAAFAAAMATGRTPPHAVEIAIRVTRPAAPP